MSQSLSKENIYIGTLIVNVIGIILLIFTDFASYYNYGYYVNTYGWIYFDLDFSLTMFIMLVPISCMIACLIMSIIPFLMPYAESTIDTINIGFLLSVIAFTVVTVGAIVFIGYMVVDEVTEWGFEAGFFGGFLGSGISTLLFYFAKQK